jgi:phosphatidylserine decarboxylase
MASSAPPAPTAIRYYNRYTQKVELETVYGQRWLEWTYHTAAGRICLHGLVKRAAFSRFYGWLMDRPGSRKRVAPFIERFSVDAAEFAEEPSAYRTFNQFFYRRLKPGARPLAGGEETALLPADGRHLAFPDVEAADGFYVKGRKFSLAALLADGELAERFRRGSMLISRLCPVDYHRFHFATAGEARPARTIPGPLFSVSPVALRQRVEWLAENKRSLTRLRSPVFGEMVCLEVGATNVGGTVQTYQPGPVDRGAEKGYFKFGGSCVILLFEPGRIRFADDLVSHSREQREVYARMGDRLGERV